jgi:hypothetical protein
LSDIVEKIAPKSFGRYFSEIYAPKDRKMRQNGEISPNLATLQAVSGSDFPPNPWRTPPSNEKRTKPCHKLR